MNAPDPKEPLADLPGYANFEKLAEQFEPEMQAMTERGEGDDPGELGDTSESQPTSGSAP